MRVSSGDGVVGTEQTGSAHLIKISAIRNPIPEPPPVMKATLSLGEENTRLFEGWGQQGEVNQWGLGGRRLM